MAYAILVNNGYRYEFCKMVHAASVQEARKLFLASCAPSQRDFKVRKLNSGYRYIQALSHC
jgi:hypothetical protein